MKKLFDFFNLVNGLLTFILTIIVIVISVKSCNISEDVANDNRQLDSQHELIVKEDNLLTAQQNQLKNQQEQLDEIRKQTVLLQLQVGEDKSIYKGVNTTSDKISKQLKISQDQQAEQLKQGRLAKRMYVNRLRETIHQTIQLPENKSGQLGFRDSLEKQIAFFKEVRSLLKEELNNFVLLENDSLAAEWINAYSYLGSTIEILEIPKNPYIIKDGVQTYDPLWQQNNNEKMFKDAYGTWLTLVIDVYRVMHEKYQKSYIYLK